MLWVEISDIYCGRESASISALVVDEWRQVIEVLLGALGLIEELKSPCGYRGFWI